MKSELIIYKSSAGSGKTYTLVMEYLKRVLKQPSLYRQILAITFTNKATEEMKTRVLNSLMDIAQNKAIELQTSISEQTGMEVSKLPGQAAKVLELILHDYSRFSISTIDSFFSKIVRALARELKLSFRFDLELDQTSVSNEITERLFDDIATDKDLLNWLEAYVFDKLDNDKGWALQHEIVDISRQLFTEQYRSLFPNGSGIPEKDFINKLKKIIATFESNMRSVGEEFLKTIEQHGLSVDDFKNKAKGPAGYFLKITGNLDPLKYVPGVMFNKAIEQAEDWTSKSSPRKKEIIDLANASLIGLSKKIVRLLENDYPVYTGALCVLNNAYMAGIIGKLDEKLNEFRTENDVILISDNNLFLQKAMEGQDAPFVYEKSGNQYSHFMLDEFQDTSDFQWQNLYPLVENALGEGHSTFIVGDAKQSIYRWRGGNMDLIQSQVQQQLHAYREDTVVKNLDSNYRSREVVVSFNNELFAKAPEYITEINSNSGNAHPYLTEEVTQQFKKGIAGEGFVEIRFFPNEKDSVDEETGELFEFESWQSISCDQTLATIRNCIEKGFRYKDIAILTRRNSEAKIITGFLVDNGISNIISPESMQLNRHPKIQFLICLLRYLNDYTDDLSLAQTVYYYVTEIKKNHSVSLHELFSAPRKVKLSYLPGSFTGRITGFRKMPLYEAVEDLTSVFELVNEPDAYIQRFLDIILEFSNNNSANLSEFLDWWEINEDSDKCSVIVPSNVDAIRVMSIHKSKGLQFPVVIMPFADWKIHSDFKTRIWVSSELEPFNTKAAHPVKFVKLLEHSIFKDCYDDEMRMSAIDNLNTLYVALTRAEEQLYVFTKEIGKDKPGDEVKNINKLLYRIISDSLTWNENFAANENTLLTIGTAGGPYRIDKESEIKSEELRQWISSPWKDRLIMVVNKQKIAVTDPELPEMTYGIHFHNIAAMVNSADQYTAEIENYISGNKLSDELVSKLRNDIDVFIGFASKYNWFGEKAETLNETDLLLNDGSILRPDRLIIENKKAVIVDYKTGAEENWHSSQVQKYANALKAMGYTECNMFLLYPSLNKVVEVTAA